MQPQTTFAICCWVPSSEERVAYFIEFVAGIQHHINRVSQCALSNGVRLIYRVELGIHHATSGATDTNEGAIWNVWESKIGIWVLDTELVLGDIKGDEKMEM